MLQALGAQLTGLSGKTPVLMILEDAHWIDPTSQGLFNLMVPMVAERSVLLVVTFRPEYTGGPEPGAQGEARSRYAACVYAFGST